MARTFVRAEQLKNLSITNAQISSSAAIALSKLATDPLARANHTGTQSADTLTDGSTNKAFTATERTRLAAMDDGATANQSDAYLLDRTHHTGSQDIDTINGLQDALDAKQASADKGQPNGYAELDGSGKVPLAQLPDHVLGTLQFQGTWNASTNSPSLSSGTGTKGYYYKVSVAGTTNLDSITDWAPGDWAVFNGTAWEKVDQSEQIQTVFGRSGNVTAQAGDYTATQVTFTPDGDISSDNVQDALAELSAEKARSDSFITRETPSGSVDGVNDTFSLDNTPIAGSETVTVNGIEQDSGSGNDYTISGDTITFETGAIPLTGDKVRVSYRK